MPGIVDVIQGRATLDISPFLNSLNQLRGQVQATTTSINTGLAATGQGATTAASGIQKLTDNINALYRAGQQMSRVGESFMILGGAIDGLIMKSIEAGQEFDFWAVKTQAVTEQVNQLGQVVQWTANQNDTFRRAIEGVTESVGALAPADVSHAFYLWTAATNTTVDSLAKLNEVSGQLDVIMKASVMSGASAQTVIRGVANAMSEFGLDTSQTAYVTAVLMNTTHMTEAEMNDLIASFKMVGPQAKAMGESIGDATATLGVMADMGIKGTQAGRGLQRVLDSFIKPAKSADDMLQGLIVTNRGLQGSWRDFIFPGGQFVGLLDSTNASGVKVSGALHQLYDGMQKLTPEQQLLAMHTMESEVGFRELLPLLEAYTKSVQSGGDVTKGFIPDIQTFSNLLGDQSRMLQLFNDKWDQVSQTIKVQFGSQINQAKFALYDLGTAAEGAILPIIKVINQVLDGLRLWARENSSTFLGIVQGVAILGTFFVALGAGLLIIGKATQAVAAFREVWMAVGTLMGVMESAFLPIIAVIGAVIVVVVAFQTAMRDNAKLAADVTTMVTAIHDAFGSLLTILNDVIQFLAGIFSGNWKQAFTAAQDIVVTFVAGFGNAFSAIGKVIADVLNGAIKWIDTTFNGLATSMIGWGRAVMGAFAQGMVDAINAYVVPAINAVIQMIANFLEGHSPPKQGALMNIQVWGANIATAFLKGFTQADFTILSDFSTMVMDHLKSEIEADKMNASDAFPIWEQQRNTMAQIIQLSIQGKQVGQDMWDSLKSALGPYSDDIETMIQKTLALGQAQQAVAAIQDQIAGLQAKLVDPQKQIDANQATIDQLNLQKDGLNIQKQGIEDGKEQYENDKARLDAEKDGLQAQKDQEQDILDNLKQQTQAINDAKQALQDQIDVLNQQKQAMQDQIDMIQRRYDIEHQQQQETLNLLKDQLDLNKAIADQALLPLTNSADAAQQALNNAKDRANLDEEPLNLKIDQLKAQGQTTSSPQVKALQAQLDQMKAEHKVTEDQLQIQYDVADHALKAAQQEAALKTKAATDSYNMQLAQSNMEAAQNKLDNQQTIDNLKNQQLNINDQVNVLKGQQDAYKAQELAIRDQTAAEDKKMAGIDKQMQVIDRQITADDRQEKLIDLQAKTVDDSIKKLDERIAALTHANAGIKINDMDPIAREIKALQDALTSGGTAGSAVKAAQQALDAAKAKLAIDQEADKIAQEINQLSLAQQQRLAAAAKGPKGPGPTSFDKMMGIGGGGPTGLPALAGINKPASPGDLSPEALQAQIMQAMGLDANGNIIKQLNPFNAVSAGFSGAKQDASDKLSVLGDKLTSFTDGILGAFGVNASQGAIARPRLRGRMGGSTEDQDAALQQYYHDYALYDTRMNARTEGRLSASRFRQQQDSGVANNLPLITAAMAATGGIPGLGALTSAASNLSSVGGKLSDVLGLFAGRALGGPQVSGFVRGLRLPGSLLGEGGLAGGAADLLGTGATQGLGDILKDLAIRASVSGGGIVGAPGRLAGLARPLAYGSRAADAVGSAAGAVGGVGSDILGGIGKVTGLDRLPIAAIKEFSGVIKDMLVPLPMFARLITEAGGAFGVFGTILGGAKAAITPLIGLLGDFLGVFLRFPIIGGILRAVPIVGWALNIIQIIQMLKAGWETNWMGMTTALKGFWSAAQPIFQDIMGILNNKNLSFGDKLGAIFGDIGKIGGDLGTALGTIIGNIVATIRANAPKWGKTISDNFSVIWKSFTDAVGDTLKTYGPIVGAKLGDLIGAAVNFIVTQAVPFALKLLAGWYHIMAEFLNNIDKAITSDGGVQGSGGSSMGKSFEKLITNLVNWVKANAPAWGAALGPVLILVMEAAFELLYAAGKLLLDLTVWFGGLIVKLIGYAMSQLGTWANQLFTFFLTMFTQAVASLVADGGPLAQLQAWLDTTLFPAFWKHQDSEQPNRSQSLKDKLLTLFLKALDLLIGDDNPKTRFEGWIDNLVSKWIQDHVGSMLGKWATDLEAKIAEMWKGAMDDITADSNPLNQFQTWIDGLMTQWFKYWVSQTSTWAGALWDKVKAIWTALLDFLNRNSISDFAAGLSKFISDVFGALLKLVGTFLAGWWPTFKDAIVAAFTSAITAAETALTGPFNGLIQNISDKINAVKAKIQELMGLGGGGSAPSGGGVAGDGVTYEGEVAAGRTALPKSQWEAAHAAAVAATTPPPGHNAAGTSNWMGGLTWVGEKGQELLNLPRGSQITPFQDVIQQVASGVKDMLYSVGDNSQGMTSDIANSLNNVADAIRSLASASENQQHTVNKTTNINVDKMDMSSPQNVDYWVQQTQHMGQ